MEKKKMGRPPSNDPKSNHICFRLNDSDFEKLQYCVEKMKTSATDFFRTCIEESYQKLKKVKKD